MAEPKMRGDAKAALIAAIVLVLLGVCIGGTGMAMVLVPPVFLLLLYVMSRIPIRQSVMTLSFCSLVFENHAENTAANKWESPLYGVGGIFLNHWNSLDRTVPILSAGSFSGEELCIGALVMIAVFRHVSGSRIDSTGRLPSPKPLVRLAYLSLGGAAFVLFTGMIRGGSFRYALWQLNAVLYVPVVFLLYHIGLRGPKDNITLAKLLVTAGMIRATFAIYIQRTYGVIPDPETGSTKLPYATTHNDTMLFAATFVVLLAIIIERVGRKATRRALLFMPVLVYGMIENNRRLVWVSSAMVLLTVYLIAPDNRWKRRVRRTLLVLSPVISVYLFLGWDHSYGTLWKPVTVFRSIVDSKSDGSTLWRQLENFDLISTIQRNPVLGVGYGNHYDEVITLPAVDYDLELYLPHNSVLGLWSCAGYLGYTAMTMLWVGGVYFAIRAYHSTKEPKLRAAAMVSFGSVLIYFVQCWGDLGLGAWTGVHLAAPAIAVAGKLAVSTGAWDAKGPAAARDRMKSASGAERTEQAA